MEWLSLVNVGLQVLGGALLVFSAVAHLRGRGSVPGAVLRRALGRHRLPLRYVSPSRNRSVVLSRAFSRREWVILSRPPPANHDFEEDI